MRDKNKGIKISVPASVSGFGIGKTCISVAVNLPSDEIIARYNPAVSGVTIQSISGYKNGLSLETAKNSAGIGATLLYDHLQSKVGIELEIHKKIPLNSGLSSCAASAVGGVFAVNELMGRPLERYDLTEFCLQSEKVFSDHSNNSQVLSILYGGVILSGNSQDERFQKLYIPSGLYLSIFYPSGIAYQKLSFPGWLSRISTHNMLLHAQNLSCFVSSLYTSNLELLKDCFKNHLLDAPLADQMPLWPELQNEIERKDILGYGLAGFGPAFFVLSPNSLIADEVLLTVLKIAEKNGLTLNTYQTTINMNGVNVC